MPGDITLACSEGVAVLTLNRPEQRNALTESMAEDFQDAILEVQYRSDVGCMVLTGAGNAFCAGADLDMLSGWMTLDATETENRLNRFYDAFLAVTTLKIPVIAGLNGPAIGAGASLAMACDMRLAARGARIGFTFVRLGLNPGMASEALLSRAVGPARTMELLMSGSLVRAEEAEGFGLVNRVVPRERLMEQTLVLANRIVAMPRETIRVIKRLTYEAPSLTLQELARIEAWEQTICYQGPCVPEGVRAVRERREPCFHNETEDSG